MVKKRIIPILLLINDKLVKTLNFDTYREVGHPVSSAKVYCAQDADELIFLNITRDDRSLNNMLNLIKKVSEVCFMPLSVGGSIKTLEDAELLIKNGADKVIVNTACYEYPELLTQIAQKFGTQAVVAGIDVRLNEVSQEYQLFSNCGAKLEVGSLEDHVKKCAQYQAGEIFINSIDKDGTMAGFDQALIKKVMSYVKIPVIACGGSGNYNHLKEAFLETDVSALACGSIFNFADNNPIRAKAFLANYDIPVKLI